MSNKGVSTRQSKFFKDEIKKNVAIYKLGQSMAVNLNLFGDTLDLAKEKLKDLHFLPKMIQEFNNLGTLDLSNSDLRQAQSVKQLC